MGSCSHPHEFWLCFYCESVLCRSTSSVEAVIRRSPHCGTTPGNLQTLFRRIHLFRHSTQQLSWIPLSTLCLNGITCLSRSRNFKGFWFWLNTKHYHSVHCCSRISTTRLRSTHGASPGPWRRGLYWRWGCRSCTIPAARSCSFCPSLWWGTCMRPSGSTWISGWGTQSGTWKPPQTNPIWCLHMTSWFWPNIFQRD